MATEQQYGKELNLKRLCEIKRSSLKARLGQYLPIWQDLSDFLLPLYAKFENGQFSSSLMRQSSKILIGTATHSLEVMLAGMNVGLVGNNKGWFQVSHWDPRIMEEQEAKEFFHKVTKITEEKLQRSTFFTSFVSGLKDMIAFGTTSILMEQDDESLFRYAHQSMGDFMISTNQYGVVDEAMRETNMKVRNIVDKFGRNREGRINFRGVSEFIKQAYISGNTEEEVGIVQYIRPNDKRIYRNRKKKPFTSIYYESGEGNVQAFQAYSDYSDGYDDGQFGYENKFLSIDGFDYFPLLCPRWYVSDGDDYGTSCPALNALNDIKMLQENEGAKKGILQQMLNPATYVPTALKRASNRPGARNAYDIPEGIKNPIGRMFELDGNVYASLMNEQELKNNRINDYFWNSLLLAILNKKARMSATEVEELKTVGMYVFKIVYGNLNRDLLDPVVRANALEVINGGYAGEIPASVKDANLKIVYTSLFARGQRGMETDGIMGFLNGMGILGQISEEAKDNLNTDYIAQEMTEAYGVSPRFVLSPDIVAEKRQRMAEQEQAMLEAEQMAQRAKTAKDLSDAKLEGNSVLERVEEEMSNAG